MKRLLCAALALVLLAAAALAEGETELQTVACPEGGFTTACEQGLKWRWDGVYGLTVYTGQPDDLPCMMICPTESKGTDFKGYFDDVLTPQVRKNLGDAPLEVSNYASYSLGVGDELVELPGVMYSFQSADGRREVLFRLFDTRWDGNVCYTLRYFEGDADATLRALGIAVTNYAPDGDGPGAR